MFSTKERRAWTAFSEQFAKTRVSATMASNGVRQVENFEHGRLFDLHGKEIHVVVLHGVRSVYFEADDVRLQAGRRRGDGELDRRFVGHGWQPQFRFLNDGGVEQQLDADVHRSRIVGGDVSRQRERFVALRLNRLRRGDDGDIERPRVFRDGNGRDGNGRVREAFGDILR